MIIKKFYHKLPDRIRSLLFWTYYNVFLISQGLVSQNTIKTYLTAREKLKLFKLASMKQGTFVEVGSYYGASASFIVAGMLRRNLSSTLYCIDTWDNRENHEEIKDTWNDFNKNTAVIKKHIVPIRMTSEEASRALDIKIDFLFIDADHNYTSVKNDIDVWFPKLNPQALVVFHDIGWSEGVRRAVSEIKDCLLHYDQLPNMCWGWVK